MSLTQHRLAAISILVTGVAGLVAWGRTQAVDPPEIRAIRDRLEGRWVATLVETGPSRKLVGEAAEGCRIEFAGKKVTFRGMADGTDARGTYMVEPKKDPARIDMKLDAGWEIGTFDAGPDCLKLVVNALNLPERLGAPSHGRFPGFSGDHGHHLYVFRRASAGK